MSLQRLGEISRPETPVSTQAHREANGKTGGARSEANKYHKSLKQKNHYF